MVDIVHITNPTDVVEVDNFIRRVNKYEMTPQIAANVLKMSNNYVNVSLLLKRMLISCSNASNYDEVTYKNLANEYKQIVLGLVCGREVHDKNMEVLFSLAKAGDYVDEFNIANSRNKVYSCKRNKILVINSADECDKISDEDLNSADVLICNYSGNAKLKYGYKLPKYCFFLKNEDVNLYGTDCSELKEIVFCKNSSVHLQEIKNLDCDVDFSACNSVDLYGLDLAMFRELNFKNGARVNLGGCSNIPKDLDFCKFSFVHLGYCSGKDFGKIKFRDGAEVILSKFTDEMPNFNFSSLQKITFNGVDLSNYDELKFGKDAEVYFSHCLHFPSKLDFSKCRKVRFESCYLGDVENIKFRSVYQKTLILEKGIYSFRGKAEVVDNKKLSIFTHNHDKSF